VGWGLLGWALPVVCVALPVWALTSGDLNEVAGWANILALPVTVLGLVLVVADRDLARVAAVAEPAQVRRRPWMAPPLDRMVRRPELAEQLITALTAPGPAEVGLTTALHGAGGFGKTHLATWACHHPEINQRYPGGLLWVIVGQEVHGADLAVRVNDLAFALCGQRPALSDPEAAGGGAWPSAGRAGRGGAAGGRRRVAAIPAAAVPHRRAVLHSAGHHPHSRPATRARGTHSGGRDAR
jgi:hypothetical protein